MGSEQPGLSVPAHGREVGTLDDLQGSIQLKPLYDPMSDAGHSCTKIGLFMSGVCSVLFFTFTQIHAMENSIGSVSWSCRDEFPAGLHYQGTEGAWLMHPIIRKHVPMFPISFQTPSGGNEGKDEGTFGGASFLLAQLCCPVLQIHVW